MLHFSGCRFQLQSKNSCWRMESHVFLWISSGNEIMSLWIWVIYQDNLVNLAHGTKTKLLQETGKSIQRRPERCGGKKSWLDHQNRASDEGNHLFTLDYTLDFTLAPFCSHSVAWFAFAHGIMHKHRLHFTSRQETKFKRSETVLFSFERSPV